MTDELIRFVARELETAAAPEVIEAARRLATGCQAVAVLYYGSTLRTGALNDILDFYVLTEGRSGTLLRRAGTRWLWPDVSYHEIQVGTRLLRAKVATMPLATFERAAAGRLLDTTIWARFVQPAARVWSSDAEIAGRVDRAVADAIVTAGRLAAVLGPECGAPRDFWLALFRMTYRAELRVEPSGREETILAHDPDRYARLLPIAWTAAGIGWRGGGSALTPEIGHRLRRDAARTWRSRARAAKALNVARLVKAAFTFEGAARYGLWKIHRHTGVSLALTPWRERHPILAAPGVLWRVLRDRPS